MRAATGRLLLYCKFSNYHSYYICSSHSKDVLRSILLRSHAFFFFFFFVIIHPLVQDPSTRECLLAKTRCGLNFKTHDCAFEFLREVTTKTTWFDTHTLQMVHMDLTC